MRTQQKAGKRVSYHAPFGWKVDPEDSTRLVRDEGEQRLVRRVLALAGTGMSPWRIAHELTQKGVKTGRGKAWTATTVAKIIRRGG